MVTAKDAHGSRLFTSGNFLTANQVAGILSRLASKKALAEDPDGQRVRRRKQKAAMHCRGRFSGNDECSRR